MAAGAQRHADVLTEKESAPPAPASFFGVEVPRPAEPPTEARVLR